MQQTIFHKNIYLFIIESVDFQLLLYDSKVSSEQATIACDVIAQADGKIIFYVSDEHEAKSLAIFFNNNTNYLLRCDDSKQYYYINAIKEKTINNFSNNRIMKVDTNNVVEDDVMETNIFAEKKVYADDPKLISISFNRNMWKQKAARKLLEGNGFRTYCNVEGKRKGCQTSGNQYIWFQNDPLLYENGLNKPEKNNVSKIIINDKEVIIRKGKLKPLK
ncbi:MAG: hypothetical protein KKD48_01925 [Nanoarchaeota archaeon]|nr:hypothetical protein [Nanoarchaeota archaeon]